MCYRDEYAYVMSFRVVLCNSFLLKKESLKYPLILEFEEKKMRLLTILQ
jgi:hypothetical protein